MKISPSSQVLLALSNLPFPKDFHLSRLNTLAVCLDTTHQQVREYYFGQKDVVTAHCEMLQRFSGAYGRELAAIKLTALGVADQYDWGRHDQYPE